MNRRMFFSVLEMARQEKSKASSAFLFSLKRMLMCRLHNTHLLFVIVGAIAKQMTTTNVREQTGNRETSTKGNGSVATTTGANRETRARKATEAKRRRKGKQRGDGNVNNRKRQQSTQTVARTTGANRETRARKATEAKRRRKGKQRGDGNVNNRKRQQSTRR